MDRDERLSRQPPFEVSPAALVTGSGGFVGAALCRLLSEKNWRLVGGHRRADSDPGASGIEYRYLPLSAEPAMWQQALRSIDCVVHLAASVHRMERTEGLDAEFRETNVDGSRFVADQCVRAGVRRLVFLSSIKVNGEGGSLRAYRAEDDPDPRDAYARSKLAAEFAVREVCAAAGTELVIIRSPLVYGAGVRANFRRLLKIADSGVPLPLRSVDNRRSLVGVRNLAGFMERCMTHPGAAGRVWLISDGDDLSTPMLMQKLRRLMHRSDRLFAVPPRWLRRVAGAFGRGGEISRLCDSLVIDPTPAYEQLNWRAPFTVDSELALTVAAFRRQH